MSTCPGPDIPFTLRVCSCAVQAKMNSFFMGSKVSMAERYASLLKTMFVCLFFSAIFPQGYFVAAMAMFMTYWVSERGSDFVSSPKLEKK